jgi:hypothetical protein
MISALSMLWPLMALASDQEEGETPSLQRIIAAWLALGDYESIVKTLGVCPLEPLIEQLKTKTEEAIKIEKARRKQLEEKGLVRYDPTLSFIRISGPISVIWCRDLDPSFILLKHYIESLKERTPGPNWTGRNWIEDYPDIVGLIRAYRHLVNEREGDYRIKLQESLSSPESRVRGPAIDLWGVPDVETWCGQIEIVGGETILAPGWYYEPDPPYMDPEGESKYVAWPNIPGHPEETWIATANRKFPESRGIEVVCARINKNEVTVWNKLYDWLITPGSNPSHESLRRFCQRHQLFLYMTGYINEIRNNAPLSQKELELVRKVIPAIGTMRDTDLSNKSEETMAFQNSGSQIELF